MRWEVTNENQLREIAQILHKQLQFPVILFQGEMGAGKTTFIKYLVEAMGGKSLSTARLFLWSTNTKLIMGVFFILIFTELRAKRRPLIWEQKNISILAIFASLNGLRELKIFCQKSIIVSVLRQKIPNVS